MGQNADGGRVGQGLPDSLIGLIQAARRGVEEVQRADNGAAIVPPALVMPRESRGRGYSSSNQLGEETMSQWREYDELELTPVLRGALAAFREHGYHGASVRDIAARVGVTVPGLYYHHRNKEAMLAALIDLSIQAVTERVRIAMFDAGDDLRKQLANTIEAVVLHMTYHVDFAFLDPEFRYLEEETSRPYADARRAVERCIAGLIDTGVDTGQFAARVPAGTARALVGMCQSVAFWYREDGPKSPKEIASEYAAIALSIVAHPEFADNK